MTTSISVALLVLTVLAACGGNGGAGAAEPGSAAAARDRSFLPEAARCPQVVPPDVAAAGSVDPSCTPRVDVVETDLNRDGNLDMRRVYLIPCPTMLGEEVRPQILCREADVNFDGRKDIFHYFREGVSHSEEQDWNFDGTIDARVWFGDGRPVSVEIDRNGDGRFEMQVLLSAGQVRRVKIDAVGDTHFDIYETYVVATEGRFSAIQSLGYDVDGDGTMDRLIEMVEADPEAEAGAPGAAPGEE